MTLRNPLTALHRFGALWANNTDNSNELLFSPDDIAEYVMIGNEAYRFLDGSYLTKTSEGLVYVDPTGTTHLLADDHPGVITLDRVADYRLDEGAGQSAFNNAGNRTPDDNIFNAPEQSFASPGTIIKWTGSGFTVTDNYSGRASRFVCGSGSLHYYGQAITLPAGTYTMSVSVQSNTGSTQKIRMSGDNTGTLSSDLTVPTGSPTTLSYTFVHPGGATGFLPITTDAANEALDILVFWAKLNAGSSATTYVNPEFDLRLGFFGTVEASADPSWVTEGVDTQGTKFAWALPTTKPTLTQCSIYGVVRFDGTDVLDGYSPILSDDFTDATLYLQCGGSAAASVGNATFGFSTANVVAYLAHLCDSQWHVVTGTYDGITLRYYVDGCELGTKTAAGLTAVTLKRLFLSNFNNAAYFAGRIGCASLYSVAHSAATVRQQVEAYASVMADRGVTVTPIQKLAAFDGDSISDLVLAAGTYPRTAIRSLTGVQGRDFAVSGSTLTDLNTRATSVDALYDPTRSKNILHILIGRNDLASLPPAASFVASLKTYCLARKAVGWTVIVGTLLPSTLAGYNAVRNSVNTLIKADASFHDAIADYGADATMGPDAAAANLTYYLDGTHPTAAGNALLAPIAAAAIASLL